MFMIRTVGRTIKWLQVKNKNGQVGIETKCLKFENEDNINCIGRTR